MSLTCVCVTLVVMWLQRVEATPLSERLTVRLSERLSAYTTPITHNLRHKADGTTGGTFEGLLRGSSTGGGGGDYDNGDTVGLVKAEVDVNMEEMIAAEALAGSGNGAGAGAGVDGISIAATNSTDGGGSSGGSFYDEHKGLINLIIIALALFGTIFSIIYFGCCMKSCCTTGRRRKGKKFDIFEELNISRTSTDDETDVNTTNNAASRFTTKEQYIDLFNGNYKYMKSRRISAHAYRLGLHKKKTSLIKGPPPELTPAEIEIAQYFNEDCESVGNAPPPLRISKVPSNMVTWNEYADVINVADDEPQKELLKDNTEALARKSTSLPYIVVENEKDSTTESKIVNKQEVLEKALTVNKQVGKLIEMKETQPSQRENYSRSNSWANFVRGRKSSLVLTSASTVQSPRVRESSDMDIMGYNPQNCDQSVGTHGSLGSYGSDGSLKDLGSGLSAKHTAPVSEARKKFQNIFKKSASYSSGGGIGNSASDGRVKRYTPSKLATEESSGIDSAMSEITEDIIKADVMHSNFPTRGNGQPNPVPTRFSPPPPESNRKIMQARQGRNSFSSLTDVTRPDPNANPLDHQNSVEPEKLAKKLNKMKSRLTTALSSNSLASSSNSAVSSPSSQVPLISKSESSSTQYPLRQSPTNTTTKSDSSVQPIAVAPDLSPPFSVSKPPPPAAIPTEKKSTINSFLESSQTQSQDIQPFLKMLKVGIPPDAVKYKMELSGLDPSSLDDVIDSNSDAPSESTKIPSPKPPPPAAIPAEKKSSINTFLASSQAPSHDIQPFLKMLKVGIPPDAVKYKMEMSGLDPSTLDKHIEI